MLNKKKVIFYNENIPQIRFNYDGSWNVKYIKNIANIVGGGTPSTSIEEYWDGDINWYTPSEIGQSKYVSDSERKITIEGLNNSSAKLLPKNTILLTTRATIGRVSITNSEATTNQGFQSVICKTIDLNFMYYLLQTLEKILIRKSVGSTFLEISKKEIENIQVNVPSLDEQKKIGDYLSLIDKKITLMENKLSKLKLINKYLLENMFSIKQTPKLRFPYFNDEWRTVSIGEIFDERIEKNCENLELLSVTILNGVIKRSEIEEKDNSSSDKSNYKHVKKSDIVYNSMRMWQGACGVSDYEGIVSPAYTILIPKNNVNPNFFGYYFKKQDMMHVFQKYSQGLTSDTWNLKYPLISKIKIKVPTIKEQNEITTFIDTINKKIKNIENEIEINKEFKKALLFKMFC